MFSGLIFITLVSQAELPLLSQKAITCRSLAESANRIIEMGETQGVAWLRQKGLRLNEPNISSEWERLMWLCRMVFVPKGSSPLRRPGIGAYFLPHLTMPAEAWPNDPLVQVQGVWFTLGEGTMIAGYPESLTNYLDYCLKEGVFTKTPYTLPSIEQAQGALETLFSEPRWRKMKWHDHAPGTRYRIPKSSVVSFLRQQASW